MRRKKFEGSEMRGAGRVGTEAVGGGVGENEEDARGTGAVDCGGRVSRE